ncbi:MAG: rhomboid family intramembrane serine protease [Pseudomonadota bacterium]
MRNDTFPPVIFALLMANAVLFVMENFFGLRGFTETHFALHSGAPLFRPWQLLTYGFLHGDLMHLALNMFALWMFGRTMEAVWGSRRFAIYFLACVVGAGIVQMIVAQVVGRPTTTVGASGGVFGVLLAFGMTFPNQRILLLIPPIPLPAKYFVLIYGVIELYFGLTRSNSGVAHFAHLGGMVIGLVLILYWRSRRQIR